MHTHEIHIHHHHHYHSQPLLTSALVYCDDYDKKVRDTASFASNLTDFLLRSSIYSNMIHPIDGHSRYSSNRKSSSIASINYYHSTKKVSIPPLEPRRTHALTLFSCVATDDLLIFVRLYNSQYESLLYAGHFLVSQQQSFRRPHADVHSSYHHDHPHPRLQRNV